MCNDRDIPASKLTSAKMVPQSKVEPPEDQSQGKFAQTQAIHKRKDIYTYSAANTENYMLPLTRDCKPVLTILSPSAVTDDSVQQEAAAPELNRCLASNTVTYNGARPKTKKTAKQQKAVKFSRTVSMEVYTTESQYENMKCCLLDIQVPPHILSSSPVAAVKFMLKGTQEELLGLLDITIKMLRVKLNLWPTCTQIYETMIEPNFDEKFVVTSFMEICQTEQGKAVVKNLLAEQQQKNEEHKRSQSEENLETTSNWSLQSADITDQNDGQKYCLEQASASNTTAADHTVLSNQDFVNEESPAVSQHGHATTSSSSVCVDQNILPTTTKILKPMTKEQMMKQQKIKLLKREHEYLANRLTCYLCKERPVARTLLPCGHFVLCAQCSNTCYVCPICNKKALAEVKTFLA